MKTATLASPARPVITSTIGALSDRALLRQASTLVRHERHLQGAIIDHLAEIETRRLYLQRGCSSLFDYAVRELGYSDAAAGRRIGAVRLCADQPDARERLRDGSLTLSAAAELQWAFDRQRRRGSIAGIASTAPAGAAAAGAAAAGADLPGSAPTLVSGAVEAMPSAPTDDPVMGEPAPPLVLDAAGRQKLVEEATGKSTRQVRRMLADLDPEMAPPADRVRPLGDGRYELKAVIDADCQQGLEHLRGLLSHVDPCMTIGQLVGRIVQEALDRHDPSRPPRRARTGNRAAQGESEPASASKEQAARERDHASAVQDLAIRIHATPTAEGTEGATRKPAPASPLSPVQDTASAAGTTPTAEWAEERTPQPSCQSARGYRAAGGRKPPGAVTSTVKPRASGRAIPAAVRRQVWHRDGGRCSYVDRQTGRRCNSRHMIEMDHILPYALGGGADPQNLRLVCRAHHRHRHAPPAERCLPEDQPRGHLGRTSRGLAHAKS